MPSLRHQRVRELLRREIGEILRKDYPIDRFGLLSVIDVQLSGDLKSARVFISSGGDTGNQQATARRLQRDRPLIQHKIASRVVLKYVPHLRFVHDPSVERGDRVLAIIEELEQSESSDPSG